MREKKNDATKKSEYNRRMAVGAETGIRGPYNAM